MLLAADLRVGTLVGTNVLGEVGVVEPGALPGTEGELEGFPDGTRVGFAEDGPREGFAEDGPRESFAEDGEDGPREGFVDGPREGLADGGVPVIGEVLGPFDDGPREGLAVLGPFDDGSREGFRVSWMTVPERD